MKGYDVQFDRENSRITLTTADCGVIELRNGQVLSRAELLEGKSRSDVRGYYVKVEDMVIVGGVALVVVVIAGIVYYVIGKRKKE